MLVWLHGGQHGSFGYRRELQLVEGCPLVKFSFLVEDLLCYHWLDVDMPTRCLRVLQSTESLAHHRPRRRTHWGRTQIQTPPDSIRRPSPRPENDTSIKRGRVPHHSHLE